MTLSFEERYTNLNIAQKHAVDTTEGPVLVVAGPGSGKTELLSLRVANILRQGLASPSNILCLTFTENAALNMRERLAALIGQDAYRVGIFTFHAFCNHIISRYPEYFWAATHFSQASDITRAEILTEIFASLPHKHPLAGFHPEKGFVYLKNVADRIKHIKSYGLTADEYEAVVHTLVEEYPIVNEILAEWPERLSIKKLDEVVKIIDGLGKINGTVAPYLAKTLNQALALAETLEKTHPLAEWKKDHMVKGEDGFMLKDAHNREKILAVAELYKRYRKEMYERALYDYDDMIIETAHALKEEPILRNALEEQYQYIMIDEFQDTNEAQMSLVREITKNPVHEGQPNVCVVGDDDQAVYKFQGAEVSHIINFRDVVYRNVQTIILDKNYRSTAPILELARSLVTQGRERLENVYQDISKILSAENITLPPGSITITSSSSDVEEYTGVARAVREEIERGTEPNDIAILSRNHRELRALLPYLDRENIPYEYIKKSNVFDEPHVKILIEMCAYISSVLKEEATADYLIPRLLAHPCFQIERSALFALAVDAKEQHKSWTAVLQTSTIPRIKELGSLLAELTVEGETTPLEHMLEKFMERSGFKEFYFSRDLIKQSPTTYVSFLASLKTFIEALREWKEGEVLFASDVLPFVQMHIDHDVALISESPFMKNERSVQLMSAHASKGLEFGIVFLIATHDDLWTKPPRTNIAPLPVPLLPLMQPAGDTEDDFIRLLYVAITRAKHTLHISSHDTLVRYLSSGDDKEKNEHVVEIPIEAHENALALYKAPFREDEWVLLRRLVENYRMPVTHMNNFIDITQGGPLYFIEQNLLRFPQPMNSSGVYGTAMHKVIEECVMYPKYHGGERAPLQHLTAFFNKELKRGRLPRAESIKQGGRGEKVLAQFYESTKEYFLSDDQIEVDMKNEGILIGEARLTGKIDFLRTKDGAYEVLDFKTGKAYGAWDEAKTDADKIKLHKYRQQLIVYKLLLENATHFRDKPVVKVALWFTEEKPIVELVLDATDEEIERTKKLVQAVYHKIINLDFPDVSAYGTTYKGFLQFEEDLIEGRV